MKNIYDNLSSRMEEQICGKVKLPRSRAGESPVNLSKTRDLIMIIIVMQNPDSNVSISYLHRLGL